MIDPNLKAFLDDKAAQLAWSEFILDKLSREILARVYAGEPVTGYKEAKDIISDSFKELAELCTPKQQRKPGTRGE